MQALQNTYGSRAPVYSVTPPSRVVNHYGVIPSIPNYAFTPTALNVARNQSFLNQQRLGLYSQANLGNIGISSGSFEENISDLYRHPTYNEGMFASRCTNAVGSLDTSGGVYSLAISGGQPSMIGSLDPGPIQYNVALSPPHVSMYGTVDQSGMVYKHPLSGGQVPNAESHLDRKIFPYHHQMSTGQQLSSPGNLDGNTSPYNRQMSTSPHLRLGGNLDGTTSPYNPQFSTGQHLSPPGHLEATSPYNRQMSTAQHLTSPGHLDTTTSAYNGQSPTGQHLSAPGHLDATSPYNRQMSTAQHLTSPGHLDTSTSAYNGQSPTGQHLSPPGHLEATSPYNRHMSTAQHLTSPGHLDTTTSAYNPQNPTAQHLSPPGNVDATTSAYNRQMTRSQISNTALALDGNGSSHIHQVRSVQASGPPPISHGINRIIGIQEQNDDYSRQNDGQVEVNIMENAVVTDTVPNNNMGEHQPAISQSEWQEMDGNSAISINHDEIEMTSIQNNEVTSRVEQVNMKIRNSTVSIMDPLKKRNERSTSEGSAERNQDLPGIISQFQMEHENETDNEQNNYMSKIQQQVSGNFQNEPRHNAQIPMQNQGPQQYQNMNESIGRHEGASYNVFNDNTGNISQIKMQNQVPQTYQHMTNFDGIQQQQSQAGFNSNGNNGHNILQNGSEEHHQTNNQFHRMQHQPFNTLNPSGPMMSHMQMDCEGQYFGGNINNWNNVQQVPASQIMVQGGQQNAEVTNLSGPQQQGSRSIGIPQVMYNNAQITSTSELQPMPTDNMWTSYSNFPDMGFNNNGDENVPNDRHESSVNAAQMNTNERPALDLLRTMSKNAKQRMRWTDEWLGEKAERSRRMAEQENVGCVEEREEVTNEIGGQRCEVSSGNRSQVQMQKEAVETGPKMKSLSVVIDRCDKAKFKHKSAEIRDTKSKVQKESSKDRLPKPGKRKRKAHLSNNFLDGLNYMQDKNEEMYNAASEIDVLDEEGNKVTTEDILNADPSNSNNKQPLRINVDVVDQEEIREYRRKYFMAKEEEEKRRKDEMSTVKSQGTFNPPKRFAAATVSRNPECQGSNGNLNTHTNGVLETTCSSDSEFKRPHSNAGLKRRRSNTSKAVVSPMKIATTTATESSATSNSDSSPNSTSDSSAARIIEYDGGDEDDDDEFSELEEDHYEIDTTYGKYY